MRRQDFDGYAAVQTGVASAIDLSHPPGAEGRDDFVGAEAGSVGEWQSVKYKSVA